MICPHCNKTIPYLYAEARKKARKKWRQSYKGRAGDKAYYQRPEVKAKRHERYIQNLIKESINER